MGPSVGEHGNRNRTGAVFLIYGPCRAGSGHAAASPSSSSYHAAPAGWPPPEPHFSRTPFAINKRTSPETSRSTPRTAGGRHVHVKGHA